MDINLSYSVSPEDLVGVLRTILLFLESINFQETSYALKHECASKGYPSVTSAKAKVLVVTPSADNKGNQTEYPIEVDGTYDLHSSIHNIPSATKPAEAVYVYYTDVANFSNEILNDDNHLQAHVVVDATFQQGTGDDEINTRYVEEFIQGPPETANMSPNRRGSTKRSPNTIETDAPSKAASKSTVRTSKGGSKESLRKSFSNPSIPSQVKSKGASKSTLKSTEKAKGKSSEKLPTVYKTEESDVDFDKIEVRELKQRFRRLQKEHRKLMSVATELTTALQTHIMGQSDNLNTMLNRCKDIYPDLFTSANQPIVQNKTPGETIVQQTSEYIPSFKSRREGSSFKIISTHLVQHNASTVHVSTGTFSPEALSDESVSSNAGISLREASMSEPLEDPPVQQVQKAPIADAAIQTDYQGEDACGLPNSKCYCSPTESLYNLKDDFQGDVEQVNSPHSMEVQQVNERLSFVTSSGSLVVIQSPQSPSSKDFLRKMSSKSCEEKELPKHITSSVTFKLTTQGGKASKEYVMSDSSPKIEQLDDAQDEDSYQEEEQKPPQHDYHVNYAFCNETPEIFVTTENLAKLIRSSRCPSVETSDSNCSLTRNQYFELDFRKLKKDLLNGDDDLKLGLVQALRWRITQSDSEVRDQIISSYIRHDLLGLHSYPNSCGQSTMELYYTPNQETPHPLQEGMARLVNTFASLTLGRDYLCQDDDLLVSLLVPLIMGTHYSKVKIDDIARDMLMATLQKLSLRNRQRLRMISAGLVEHLVTFLANKHTTVSAYCMEYTTALFMNLCLHREARERLHASAGEVVRLLADLLSTKHQCCMPYVNGAMYSLLGDPYINQEAQRLNLSKLIEYHVKRTDGEMRRQLKFILKLHMAGPAEGDCGCDPNIGPDNEVDLLEPELDSGDSYDKQPSGESLLKNYKMLFTIYGSQVYATHLKCLCRPVTPFPQSRKQSAKSAGEAPVEAEPQAHEKSTHLDHPKPRPCTATRAPAESAVKPTLEREQKPPMRPKRGGSEPLTTLKDEKAKRTPMSEQSSPLHSPRTSFCEETQQFYHTPSAKAGIFEQKKPRKLHRVPPSFTRTIPLPVHRMEHPPMTCSGPTCPYPYAKTMPITPKENSSVKNPPYALDYDNFYPACYREGYRGEKENSDASRASTCNCYTCKNVCPGCNKRNKYACGCYNIIKGSIDDTSHENREDDNRNDNNAGTCKCDKSHQTVCANCHNKQNNPSTKLHNK